MNCDNCSKVFKTVKTLTTHKARYHTVVVETQETQMSVIVDSVRILSDVT